MKPIDAQDAIREALRVFAAERDWDQFHTPKNLVMALAGEVGEVIEHFQWLDPDESRALTDDRRDLIALELADVYLYLLRLADVLALDLNEAARRKLAINAERYPVDRARGCADKYDQL